MHLPHLLGRVLGAAMLKRSSVWISVLACSALVGVGLRVERDLSGALIALFILSSAVVGLLQQTLP